MSAQHPGKTRWDGGLDPSARNRYWRLAEVFTWRPGLPGQPGQSETPVRPTIPPSHHPGSHLPDPEATGVSCRISMYSFLDRGRKEGACIWRGLYSLSTGLWPCPEVSHGLSVTCSGHKTSESCCGQVWGRGHLAGCSSRQSWAGWRQASSCLTVLGGRWAIELWMFSPEGSMQGSCVPQGTKWV